MNSRKVALGTGGLGFVSEHLVIFQMKIGIFFYCQFFTYNKKIRK